jgi:hypothetical protein
MRCHSIATGACRTDRSEWPFDHERGRIPNATWQEARPNTRFSIRQPWDSLFIVSTVTEIQEAIPRLSREEVEAIRDWIEDYLEARLELSDEATAKLDQSRREIAAGKYTTRQPR